MKTDRPTCMYCQKPLQKYTIGLNVYEKLRATNPNDLHTYGTFYSKEELQAHLDEGSSKLKVIRVHYYLGRKDRPIYGASVWDGESYGNIGDSLFCSNGCAERYGRRIAKRIRDHAL